LEIRMNERIKELAKQADIKLDYFGYGVDIDGGNPNVSKFAELLIKETLQVARAGMEYGPSMDEVVYKYFGIKE